MRKGFKRELFSISSWVYWKCFNFCEEFASFNLSKIFTLNQHKTLLKIPSFFNLANPESIPEMFSLEYYHQNYYKHKIISPHHSLWLIWEHAVLFLHCVSYSWISKHDTLLAFGGTLLCKLPRVQYLSKKRRRWRYEWEKSEKVFIKCLFILIRYMIGDQVVTLMIKCNIKPLTRCSTGPVFYGPKSPSEFDESFSALE